jgi:hypothetical protein
VATATKQRRRTVEAPKGKNGSSPYVAGQFAAGSLEIELSDIGKAVPAREWAKVPRDYFANLDHYSTADRRRSEAGLRGHALLGCSSSSTRSVPCTVNPRSGGAGRSPLSYD